MRNILSIILLILTAILACAQNTEIKKAVWSLETTTNSGQFFNDIYYQRDSVINGKSYLYFTASRSPNFSRPIRIDNNKVFIFDGVEERAIYDWSLTKGDSIKWFGDESNSVYFYIDSISTRVINGKSRRSQIGHLIDYNITVIENVGIESENGYFNLIYPFDPTRSLLLGGISNFCSYTSDGLIYEPFKKYNCDKLSNLEVEINDNILIYPNPTDEFLRILPNEFLIGADYKIYNSTGQIVLKGFIDNLTINVSSLDPGIYYLSTDKQNIFLNFIKY